MSRVLVLRHNLWLLFVVCNSELTATFCVLFDPWCGSWWAVRKPNFCWNLSTPLFLSVQYWKVPMLSFVANFLAIDCRKSVQTYPCSAIGSFQIPSLLKGKKKSLIRLKNKSVSVQVCARLHLWPPTIILIPFFYQCTDEGFLLTKCHGCYCMCIGGAWAAQTCLCVCVCPQSGHSYLLAVTVGDLSAV